MPALIQLRSARQRPTVALAARRFNVLGRKNRLFPGQRAVMSFSNCGCGTLTAMAHGASELVELVRNHRMWTEGLRAYIIKAGFFQADVTTGAAVGHAQFGQPDLLNPALEMTLQRDRIAAVGNHLLIAVL